MHRPSFAMDWVFILLALTSLSSLVIGDRRFLSDLIRTTYEEHSEEMRLGLLALKQNGMKMGKQSICNTLGKYVSELGYFDLQKINVEGQILCDVFNNNNEVYELILDDFSTIKIPGLIECIPQHKNKTNKDVVVDGKALVYFYVLYLKEKKNMYVRAAMYDQSQPTKTVFKLKRLELAEQFLKTYTFKRDERKLVKAWFNRAKDKKTKTVNQCVELSTLGKISEQTGTEWEIVNGEAVTGQFYMYLTKTIEIEMNGILKCGVKLKNSSSDDIKEKYFAAHNVDGIVHFVFVYGPLNIGRKKTFALQLEFYEMLRENLNRHIKNV